MISRYRCRFLPLLALAIEDRIIAFCSYVYIYLQAAVMSGHNVTHMYIMLQVGGDCETSSIPGLK